ncbi:MAG TPA: endonuclease/exonuclease/phosphatase family protein [Mucilaginibacter sp.]|jgi:endonuclease/exonuclease/phosphatase family metal-dependent hydrolase|nr:endonuclease/exonuclease/phosphatase family protein [Mucilaginibacter sp.]
MKAKKGLNFIDRIFLWINLFLCSGLLISYLAPIINPEKFWPIAFFGLAYPFLLLGNVILIAYWLFRKSKWMVLSIVTIALGWNVLNKNIGLRFPSAYGLKKEGTIRVMTYNVHNFKRYGAKNDISTKHEILEIISQQQPDIIGFQEFYSRNRGQYNMLDSIQKILKSKHYFFEAVVSNPDEAIGLAIFSKLPIVAHGFIQLTEKRNENQCIYVDVKKGEKIFRIYSVHLQSIRFDPDDYRYLNDISQQDKPEASSAKRLGYKLKIAFQKRSEQVFKIKRHADSCSYPYIISGDFNDTPTSFAVNEMCKGLKNTFREKGSGMGRTYNGSFPNYQIDYIMVGKQFDVMNYDIVEKRLSDHYPVCSDLLLR